MKLTVLLVAVCVLAVSARPRFLAIPLDDVQLVEIDDVQAPLIRVARQVDKEVEDRDNEGGRYQRGAYGGADGHDYVDYGAHTGHHGAFGWYADFPVHKGH